jgi:hypothetical protein
LSETCEQSTKEHRGAKAPPTIEARIGRAVYYELVALAEPGLVHGREMLGVWSQGCFFALGEMPSEADWAEDGGMGEDGMGDGEWSGDTDAP